MFGAVELVFVDADEMGAIEVRAQRPFSARRVPLDRDVTLIRGDDFPDVVAIGSIAGALAW
jgi:hypothetical protein